MDVEKDDATHTRVSRREFTTAVSVAVASATCATSSVSALAGGSNPRKLPTDRCASCVQRGVGYLASYGQTEDGAFSRHAGVGVTAIVTTALLRHGRSTHDPLVAKSLRHIETFVQPDGGIYSPGGMLANYETCLAVMCLEAARKSPAGMTPKASILRDPVSGSPICVPHGALPSA